MKPNPEIIVSMPEMTADAVAEIGFVRVTGYRLYGLDGVSKVASGEWIEAEDDQAAIEVAKEMMDGRGCELWQGSRRVARLAPTHR